MQEKEIWKHIENERDCYFVSNKGRVKREAMTTTFKDGRVRTFPEMIMKPTLSERGLTVSINCKMKSVAKLVATAFIPNPRGLKQLYHKDGNILNNDVSNLAWGLPSVELFDGNGLSEIEWLKLNYDVTRDGRIIRKVDGKELTPSPDWKGYLRIRLKNPAFAVNKDGRKAYKVHRLVAMYHLEDYSDDLQVNHKNGVKHDNRVENLEMVTNAQNALHAYRCLDSTERRRRVGEKNAERGKAIKCVQTGQFFKSTVDASRQMEIPSSAIYDNVTRNGNSKKLKGFSFIRI